MADAAASHASLPPLVSATGASPAWVLLVAEGKVRGFRNALAFRRWCRRRGVADRRDGKLLWVSPRDVDRAIEGLGAPPPPPANNAEAVDRAVAALTGAR